MTTIRLPAKMESLEKFLEIISVFAKAEGYSQNKRDEMELVIEEVLVNIIHYAYPESTGEVEIRYRKQNDTKLILEIRDNGIPFDPLSLSEPSLTADLSDRKVGGLGVFFIREVTDDIQYRRDGDANVLTLTFAE